MSQLLQTETSKTHMYKGNNSSRIHPSRKHGKQSEVGDPGNLLTLQGTAREPL